MPLTPETYDTAIKFLIEVGKLAVSELKERWTLARQKAAEKKKSIDLSNPVEVQGKAEPLLRELASDYGEEKIRQVIKLVTRKQELIFEWQQRKIDIEQEYNRQRIDLSSYRFQKRDLDEKIQNTLREIENDFGQLGLTIIGQPESVVTDKPLLIEPAKVATVRLDLDTYTLLAGTVGDGKFPDRLIHGKKFKSTDEPFVTLEQFLITTIKCGLTVEVYSSKAQISSKIGSPNEFWVMLLSSLSIDANRTRPLKWLITETVVALKNKSLNPDSIIYKLWEFISQQYCNQLSPYYRPNIIDAISNTAAESASQNHESLFLFFSFLYDLLKSDLQSIRRIAENLERFDDHLGNDASPSFLERLKILISNGKTMALRDVSDIPQFKPQLVPIPINQFVDYEFQSMVYPLTVFERFVIRKVLPPKDSNASHPFTFRIVSDEGESLFNVLASEVGAIVKLCNERYESSENHEWDVPTIVEWLSLSDCLENKYPWGNEPPTPQHANVDFGTFSKIRPVGTYPLGASKFGTHDCCGNVHEIVRISNGNHFPGDFRLMGGCYQTSVRFASCQIARPFKPKDEDNRRNVGVRLIRFHKRDSEKRFVALRKFLNAHLQFQSV